MADSRRFRDALGRYPTGVAIVTTFADGKALGMTVNSFASVSLDPPLVLWSVEKGSDRHGLFTRATHWGVNVLAADQSELANACAMKADIEACGGLWGGDVVPLLEGAVARFTCQAEAVHPGGDHDILVGRVIALETPRDAPSLVFHRSSYSEAG